MTDRATALALSVARNTVMEILSEDEQSNHDVEGIVKDLVAQGLNMHDMGTVEIYQFIAPHELDDNGVTDAALAAAVRNSVTGWSVFVKRGRSEVQMISVRNPKLTTENMVRGHVQALFGDDVEASIFPLVG